VIQDTQADEVRPTIAMNRATGHYVVAFDSTQAGVSTVGVVELSAATSVLGRHQLPGAAKSGASVSIDGDHKYLVAFETVDVGGLGIGGRWGTITLPA
jgi:hypothetical protein